MPSPINDPLWDMMLSTNDCYPGCGCEDDHFRITKERLGEWVSQNGKVKAKQAIGQLKAMEKFSNKELKEFCIQTNIVFGKKSDYLLWVQEWQNCLAKCIA